MGGERGWFSGTNAPTHPTTQRELDRLAMAARARDRAYHSDVHVPAIIVVVVPVAVVAPVVVGVGLAALVSAALAAGRVPAPAGLEAGYAPAVDHVLVLGDVVAQLCLP